jgi:hypothetical protein
MFIVSVNSDSYQLLRSEILARVGLTFRSYGAYEALMRNGL